MGKIKTVVRWHAPNAIFVMLSLSPFLCAAEPSADELRIGSIGLDTSHSANFTKIINGPEATDEFAMCRVVAAYPRGSRDITASLQSVPQITQQVQGLGVEIVPSIDALLKRIDCVLLESNDGRVHLEQALPVLRTRKPVFIDKPIAGSLADTVAIYEAAQHYKTPVFTSSSLRYTDVAVGTWNDGRIGTFRGRRKPGNAYEGGYGGTAFGTKGSREIGGFSGYESLLVEVINFFRTGKSPVSAEETIEIYAFMEAADESKCRGGASIQLELVLSEAKRQAKERLEALDVPR